jgi:2-polyprenyl-3-methyl-5-hydroxy-6-metoxy-1,4-benzoquinol methylase
MKTCPNEYELISFVSIHSSKVEKHITHCNSCLNTVLYLKKHQKEIKQYGKKEISRYKNTYDVTDSKEQFRISLQRNLTLREDCSVISKLILDQNSLNILDIGCNNGDNIISRLDNINVIDKVVNLIGIDVNSQIISDANNKHTNSKFNFFEIDVESNDFIFTLNTIMKEKNIESFDLITIPMVLIHLKKPYKLLKNIRKLLSKNGSLFIRDMDDGVSIAYPDDDNLVSKMLKISSSLEDTGFRENGRQIYSLLQKSGFKNISLHPESINTIHRSHDEREALFQINFNFVLGDLKLAKEKYPNDDKLANDYDWMIAAYEELEELFQRDDFFYQMGTVVYSATNK